MKLGPVLDPVLTFPEGIEADVTFFCTSDEGGVSCELTLKHVTSFASPSRMREEVAKMLKTEEFSKLATDWRLMTKDEVKEYHARQQEESAAHAHHDHQEGERASPAEG